MSIGTRGEGGGAVERSDGHLHPDAPAGRVREVTHRAQDLQGVSEPPGRQVRHPYSEFACGKAGRIAR